MKYSVNYLNEPLCWLIIQVFYKYIPFSDILTRTEILPKSWFRFSHATKQGCAWLTVLYWCPCHKMKAWSRDMTATWRAVNRLIKRVGALLKTSLQEFLVGVQVTERQYKQLVSSCFKFCLQWVSINCMLYVFN